MTDLNEDYNNKISLGQLGKKTSLKYYSLNTENDSKRTELTWKPFRKPISSDSVSVSFWLDSFLYVFISGVYIEKIQA